MKINKLLAIIVCVLLLISGCIACDNPSANVSNSNVSASNSQGMFTKICRCGDFYIVYDNETKVMYAVSNGHYNYGNLTLLVNADGTPKLYDGE